MARTSTDLSIDALQDPLALLNECVRIITGLPNAEGRPGQAKLTRDIVTAMENTTHLAGCAPTGSGKSMAMLSAAFRAALLENQRTVISTDSLSLMGQLEDKDVDVVREAAAKFNPGREVKVAFIKGVSNYIDPMRTVASAQIILGVVHLTRFDALVKALEADKKVRGLDQFPGVEDADGLRELVLWALRQYLPENDDVTGDRHSCPVDHTAAMWAAVSSSSSEADDGASYAVTSKLERARQFAADADIIVTNHSVLAVQAARALPIIVGSVRFGWIDHVIVDEAHTLPGHVRSQGATKFSGRSIMNTAYAVQRAVGAGSSKIRGWMNDADGIANEVDHALADWAKRERTGVVRLTANDQPLSSVYNLVKTWITAGSKLLGKANESTDAAQRLKGMIAKDRLDSLNESLNSSGQHRSGWARWIERDENRGSVSVNTSPVGVSFLLRDNLWTAIDPDDPTMKVPLTVVCISATLPDSFPHQAGVSSALEQYPSPFETAYANSALYIPAVIDPDELAQVTSSKYGKVKFDSAEHPKWAVGQIVELVRASGGRALILSAKADDGRMYAERLRQELPHITIHSQWDGLTPSRVAALWRDDIDSVLVGTKSLMTGVDAPGFTNELVIVDRIPRSPSNPLDDARVEEIVERTGDKWAADRWVYAQDAALLASQAYGRLIRSTSDRGMVANLDPRLLKIRGGSLAYQEQTRLVYMKALYPFGQKLSSLADATAWLRARRAE